MRRIVRVGAWLAAFLALMIGLGLFSSPERVTASDDTVTNVLQPGWNLAGWTEPAAPVETIFERIPELQVVYSWDANFQRFRLAMRTDPGGLGDLRRLTPGMGLWLGIGGGDSVTWTRPLVREASVARLSPGWNLVVWAGEDDTPANDALEAIEDILRFVSDDDGRALRTLATGDVVWVEVDTAREWNQRYVPPVIEFLTDVSPGQEREVAAHVEHVMDYFQEVTGVRVPGLTIRYGDPEMFGCGGYYWTEDTSITMAACLDVFPHEYVHALQDYLDGSGPVSPLWLLEGTADLWAAIYHDFVGESSYSADLLEGLIARARSEAFVSLVGHGYASYHIRALYLANLAGLESVFDFYKDLSLARSWEDSFRRVFGITVSQFTVGFAEYTVALPLPSQGCPISHLIPEELRDREGVEVCTTFEGTIKDLSGKPRSEIRVVVTKTPGSPSALSPASTTTDSKGSFSLSVPQGKYWVVAQAGIQKNIFYGEEGATHFLPSSTAILADGNDLRGIEIAYGYLRVVIRGLEQNPGMSVELWHGRSGVNQQASQHMEYVLPRGTYDLRMYCPVYRSAGWYNQEHGLVDDLSRATPIIMDDADVGIVIDLPSGLCD